MLTATPGLFWPPIPDLNIPLSFNNTSAIDATGEKLAMLGQVPKSGDITRVQFRFNSVTKAGGSALTVSLQDVDATSAFNRPDETQDQTVAIANADAGFASTTWYRTNALSANRTVVAGELLAVVIEYDGAGRLGSDTVNFSGLDSIGTNLYHLPGVRIKAGGTWAAETRAPNMLLEYADGSFGGFSETYGVMSATSSTGYGSNTNPDEHALRFMVPFRCKVDGAWWWGRGTMTANFDLVLTQDPSTELAAKTFDASQVFANTGSSRETHLDLGTEVTLVPGVVYYLSIRPSTTNQTFMYWADVNTATHMASWSCGADCHHATRNNGGAWSATTTRRPMIGARISALDDGRGEGFSVNRSLISGVAVL